MLRRNCLSVATAVGGWGLVGQGALAQVITPAGFGTPGGTVPFGPEVFKERRGQVMQAL
jgi:Xaa-Pro aminopeptidase